MNEPSDGFEEWMRERIAAGLEADPPTWFWRTGRLMWTEAQRQADARHAAELAEVRDTLRKALDFEPGGADWELDVPALARTVADELAGLTDDMGRANDYLRNLIDGKDVPPGNSGGPTAGWAERALEVHRQALADLAAERALVGELKAALEGVRGYVGWMMHHGPFQEREEWSKAMAAEKRMIAALARTPADASAELAALREVARLVTVALSADVGDIESDNPNANSRTTVNVFLLRALFAAAAKVQS